MTDRRTVLISGASGGVGRGIAIACGSAGWEVWIAARREAEGTAVADEVRAAGGIGRYVECDVGDGDSVAAVVAQVNEVSGQLHGLVHNATSAYSSQPKSLADSSMVEFEDHIRVNLRGLYLLATACFDLLSISRGSLVVLTSEAGFEGKPVMGMYAMAKAAQRGLAGVLAREWGPVGIRVNCVAPLATSPAMERYMADPVKSAQVLRRIPISRLGDPVQDIGPVVRFLISEESSFVTGQTIMIDGGSCPIT